MAKFRGSSFQKVFLRGGNGSGDEALAHNVERKSKNGCRNVIRQSNCEGGKALSFERVSKDERVLLQFFLTAQD